ncbi:uncharacterized protein [Physcomitrium patens]|uniref:uncharacterized protein isoform X2 n=1 Tax=Physcomitrium patens TaxID=3218 RepID=UPI003CCCD3BA
MGMGMEGSISIPTTPQPISAIRFFHTPIFGELRIYRHLPRVSPRTRGFRIVVAAAAAFFPTSPASSLQGTVRMSLDGEKMLSKSQTIKLVSAEGFEFIIDRKAAVVSNTLRNMLSSSGNFTETELGEVKFPEISTPILEKVCQYFYWSLQFSRIEVIPLK